MSSTMYIIGIHGQKTSHTCPNDMAYNVYLCTTTTLANNILVCPRRGDHDASHSVAIFPFHS